MTSKLCLKTSHLYTKDRHEHVYNTACTEPTFFSLPHKGKCLSGAQFNWIQWIHYLMLSANFSEEVLEGKNSNS